MTQSVADTRRRLANEFDAVVDEAEKLLAAIAASGGEEAKALRASAERSLSAAARSTDEYVRENPWQSVGIAALVAGLAGFLIGMINRR
ncbi:MAG TPA: DUF883 family protein [Usitatibacter sp.]|nr:DUF883 family protein [Usitatibacter sp.]